jgi:hypothetical protein
MRISLCFAPVLLAACGGSDSTLVQDQFDEPTLELTTPAAGGWMQAGPVQVDGIAKNLDHVRVGDSTAQVDHGEFTGVITLDRGINVVEASGLDEHGDQRFVRNGVLAGDFGDPGVPIEHAAAIRLNQGGLDAACGMAASLLDPGAIAADAMAANPVYTDSYGIFGWDAVTIRADIAGLYFTQPRLTATPSTGMLTADAQIPDLWLQVTASGDVVGWDFSVDVWLWASVADIAGDLTIDADNGKLIVNLEDARVNLVGFGYDTSLLPSDVESYLFVDAVRGFLEDELASQIEEKVPALLEDQLAGLDLSFDTEVMGKPVSLAAEIQEAGVDRDGLLVDVDLDVHMPQGQGHEYEGYLLADGGRADPDTSADIGMSMSDDLMNRVLFEAWRAGVLDMRMSTDDGSLDPILLTQLKADEGTITINPTLPPVIVQKDGRLQAQMGELNLVIDTPGGQLGNHLEASVTAFIDLDVKVRDGVLKLALGHPEVVITVRDSDWGADNETVTNLLQQMLPVDAMIAMLGDIELPLPAIGNLSIDRATVSREESGTFTGVAVELQ